MAHTIHVEVHVDTGSRLHLGFYGLLATTRIYGGIGLAVDKPGFRIRAVYPGMGLVSGCQAERARRILDEACRAFSSVCGEIDVYVHECIPAHRGFGSTTQFKMAIYSILALVEGKRIDSYSIARLAGRGRISAIGVGAFMYGGFIVDAGRPLGADDYITPILARLEFPQDWGIVVAIPKTRWRVEEGPEEDNLLAKTVPIDREDYLNLLDALLRRIMAGIADRDFIAFTEGVETLQEITGRYFSEAQGGIYCCREAEEAINALREVGARGVGQSSWGPSVYGFFPSTSSAERACQKLRRIAERRGLDFEAVIVTKARNRGAVFRRRWLVRAFPAD